MRCCCGRPCQALSEACGDGAALGLLRGRTHVVGFAAHGADCVAKALVCGCASAGGLPLAALGHVLTAALSFVACGEPGRALHCSLGAHCAPTLLRACGRGGANLPFGSSPNCPLGAVKTVSERWGVHSGKAPTPGSGRLWVGSFLGQTKVHLPAGFSCTPSLSPDGHARGLGP